MRRRFHRSREQRWIAGVCGGLGEFFNINPILIRIGFLFFFLFSLLGKFLYESDYLIGDIWSSIPLLYLLEIFLYILLVIIVKENPNQLTRVNFISKGHNILPVIIGWFGTMIILNDLLKNILSDPLSLVLVLFSYAGIFGIAALSLNLEVGVTGLSNFGKIAFFMVGCYGTGLVILLGYPFYFAIPIGMILAGLTGYLLALPTLNLRQDYLAIVTIAVGEILRTMLLAEDWIAWPQGSSAVGGASGLTVENIFRVNINSDLVLGSTVIPATVVADFIFLLVISFLLFVTYLFLEILYNSPWGRVLNSIRDNEIAAESLGKNVVAYRIKGFILASAITGFGGGIWALYFVSFTPVGFKPELTFFLWIIIIIGGLGNNRGVLIGTLLVWGAEFLTRQLKVSISQLLGQIASLLNPINTLLEQIASLLDPLKGLPLVTGIQDLVVSIVPSLQDFITMNPINAQKIFFGITLILFLIYRPQGIVPERRIVTIANTVNTASSNEESDSTSTDQKNLTNEKTKSN